MVPVRYGMIGFGGIAENRIAKEGFGLDSKRFTPHPRAQLCGACDQNPARRSAAEALGVEWYDDTDSLISDSHIEAILVATNNRTHASLAKKALLAGKHVFLEKPAGVTEVEIKELVDLAQAKGLSLIVDHMMTKNSYNLLAREMVRGKWSFPLGSRVRKPPPGDARIRASSEDPSVMLEAIASTWPSF